MEGRPEDQDFRGSDIRCCGLLSWPEARLESLTPPPEKCEEMIEEDCLKDAGSVLMIDD